MVYVIALEPEERLSNLILEQKYLVKKISGDQIYLNHPPHITVYIMFKSDLDKIKKIVEDVSKNTIKMSLEIKGLDFFKDDKKTNDNTIFYDFLGEKELKSFQEKIILSLSNLDDSKEKYFYIKNKWHPHITIASIKKERFNEVLKKLRENELIGKFNIDKVVIYSYIHPEPPIKIKSFELKNA